MLIAAPALSVLLVLSQKQHAQQNALNVKQEQCQTMPRLNAYRAKQVTIQLLMAPPPAPPALLEPTQLLVRQNVLLVKKGSIMIKKDKDHANIVSNQRTSTQLSRDPYPVLHVKG